MVQRKRLPNSWPAFVRRSTSRLCAGSERGSLAQAYSIDSQKGLRHRAATMQAPHSDGILTMFESEWRARG